jgi:CheY-like chemotaxis protein
MFIHRCQVCHRLLSAGAERCAGCATAVQAGFAQTQPPPARAKPASSGAIWLDDLTQPQPQATNGARRTAATVPGELHELTITLLDVQAGAPASVQRCVASALPQADALLLSTHQARLAPAPAAEGAPVVLQPAQPKTVQARRKAERRAAVRKSRLRGKAAAGAASTASAVLVFDPHEAERNRLCNLLRDFGFRVFAAGRVDEAAALAASHNFAAAFVEIAFDAADGGAGIDLCKQVHAGGACRGDTLLVLTASRLQPMDRVRAELAGCDETLLKPVTRGNVAGVLDSRGIALPIDRRQS